MLFFYNAFPLRGILSMLFFYDALLLRGKIPILFFYNTLSHLRGVLPMSLFCNALLPRGYYLCHSSVKSYPFGEYYLYYSSAMLNPGNKSCYCQLPASLVHLYQRTGSLASRAFNDKDPVDRSHAGFNVRNTHSHRLFR